MTSNGATAPETPLDDILMSLLGTYEETFGTLPDGGALTHLTQEQFADALRAAIATGKPLDPADYPRPTHGESKA